MSVFVYDRILEAHDICNYKKEISRLQQHVANSDCIRLYGLRNFGKTSILKNVIGHQWNKSDTNIFVYVDFYSVQTIDDISLELSLAFNRSMSRHSNLIDSIKKWGKVLTGIRPTWKPSDSDFGEFSFTTTTGDHTPPFDLTLENIGRLNKEGKLRFLLVFDEFQEIAKIPKAEAKLRGSLQELGANIPVVVSGSKYHLLQKMFETPKAPFHQWGFTIELNYIDYNIYSEYINDRFSKSNKDIDFETSAYIQDKMHRIPESINKICEFIRIDPNIKKVDRAIVDMKILEYVDLSRSTYSNILSHFTAKENKVIISIAKQRKSYHITGSQFLNLTDLSKSGVYAIVNRLLDSSVIYRFEDQEHSVYYQISDPLFEVFLNHYR